MKTLDTIAGKMYVVMSPNGGTVTSADGLISETVEAGKQKIIIGTGAQLQLDDAAGKIVATFNSAPAKLRLLGLLGGGVQVDSGLMKYANCVTVADMQAVNPDYKKDLTPDKEWIYPLTKLENGQEAFDSTPMLFKVKSLPSLKKGGGMFGRIYSVLQEVEIDMPVLVDANCMFVYGRQTSFKGDLSSLENGKRMFDDGYWKKMTFTTFESVVPKLVYGDGMFNYCRLDKDSVLRICSSVPTWQSGTHNLWLGIHVDHQTDEDVLSAIAAAEAKGWTITVQWNGTATAQTASTFGLRKPPIYAKLGTHELPDGTSEAMLDWGHYVTDWEASGYQEFSSVEEAEEHFNIKETNHETF